MQHSTNVLGSIQQAIKKFKIHPCKILTLKNKLNSKYYLLVLSVHIFSLFLQSSQNVDGKSLPNDWPLIVQSNRAAPSFCLSEPLHAFAYV